MEISKRLLAPLLKRCPTGTPPGKSTPEPSQARAKVRVEGLWKVFGPRPQQVLNSEWRSRGRSEVLEATGHVVALRDVSFHVAVGETFVVMGLSGSGKSTLVRCLLRLIEPSAGRILVDGEDLLKYSRRRLVAFRRHKAGMVFQRYALLPHRTVEENVAWGLELQGLGPRKRRARAQELLELVGLKGWESHYPHQLSGGMQQRVGLARALAPDPQILLMDEPFSALDPMIRREMQGELIRLQEQLKKTIIFITHDLDEAIKLGDRIAIMRDGEIVQVGTPEEIVATPADDYVAEFTRDVRKAEVLPVRVIMQTARVRLYEWQGPQVALHEMRQAEGAVAFVVDKEEALVGMVTLQAAVEAAASGASSLRGLTQVPPIILQAEASVAQMLAEALDYDWRVELLPVVDDRGRLVGEVHRTVMRSLAVEAAPKVFSPRHGAEGTPSAQDVPSPA